MLLNSIPDCSYSDLTPSGERASTDDLFGTIMLAVAVTDFLYTLCLLVFFPRPIWAERYCRAIRRPSILTAFVTTLQPTIYNEFCLYFVQLLTLIPTKTNSSLSFCVQFLGDSVALLWIHLLTGDWGPPLLPLNRPQYVMALVHIRDNNLPY